MNHYYTMNDAELRDQVVLKLNVINDFKGKDFLLTPKKNTTLREMYQDLSCIFAEQRVRTKSRISSIRAPEIV